jgi:hypothetical protein
MSKTTFPATRLRDVIWGDEGKVLSNTIDDTGRWSLHRTMLFELDGKTWQVSYSEGATENCDERPFEFDGPDIECIEVVPVQQTITVYLPLAQVTS